MPEIKRHHYVPRAYLKAFCDPKGKLLVYRKDAPSKPLSVTPDATQFRKYYYSQPTPEGGQDNKRLEALFSEVETHWPPLVASLLARENVNDRLHHLFEFMSLQRVRVPAARDAAEAMLAQTVKDTMLSMRRKGELPEPPAGMENLLDHVEVSIDPHQSIHAMPAQLQGLAELYNRIGIAAVHNLTSRPFLTSDNPVIWFDQSVAFDEQRPYTFDPDSGDVFFFFPVSPRLAIVGSVEHSSLYSKHGLLHSEVSDEAWVCRVNEQVSRFGYEAVIASQPGQEDLIARHASVSPVHEAISVPFASGFGTLHRQVFGARTKKPKWQANKADGSSEEA